MTRFRRFMSALGLGGGDAANIDSVVADIKPTKGKALRSVFGAVGTLNFQGYLTDLGEYNDDFKVNETAFAIYEQMRRSDPQVYALLSALSLPVLSARWNVIPAKNSPTPLEKEAAELIRDNFLGDLEYTSPAGFTVSQSWDEVIRHALLMLPFGASAAEEIYAIDGDTIRLQRFDARMPPTFWRWHADTDGQTLLALEQIAYRGSNLQFWKIPADKLTICSFQREGAYFAGRSMLRACYLPWFYKTQLETVEGIAAERNGMGIPVGIHGPNAAAEDRKLLNQWVTQIATHQSVGLALPNGSDFKLVGVAGKTFDLNTTITRHQQNVTRAGLASFLDLGTSATGSRSVGDTLSDFFFVAEQALADQVCFHLTTGPLRRLVDLNYPGKFGRGRNRYPSVIAANVQSRSIQATLQVLDKLASTDLLRPDDPTEDYLRDELGFPSRDPKSVRIDAQTKVTLKEGPPAAGGPAPAPAPAPGPASTPGAAVAEPTAEKGGEEAAVNAESAKMSAAGAASARRAPVGAEVHVKHDEAAAKLDEVEAAVAAELRAAKPRLLAAAAKQLAGATPGQLHRVSLPLDEALAAQVRTHLERVYGYGRQMVGHEMAAQRAGKAPAKPQTEVVKASAVMLAAADQLSLLADTTVSQLQNQLTARAAAAALAAQRKGQPVQPQQVVDDVDGQPDGWIDRGAAEATNSAISSGRQDEFQQHRDEIDRFVYSAMLDANTCGPCSDADGKEGSEDEIPAVPNPECEGGDQCRCMWVAVFKDEGGAA